MDHYVNRVRGIMQLLQQQDIIGRTSELARVFGIQFFHVLTRGSQVPMHITYSEQGLVRSGQHENVKARRESEQIYLESFTCSLTSF